MAHDFEARLAVTLLAVGLVGSCRAPAGGPLPAPAGPTPPIRCVDRGDDACAAACDAGDGHACTTLAMMVSVGLDKTRDAHRMVAVPDRACSLGHAGGCLLAAQAIDAGAPDTAVALEAACGRGDALACRSAGLQRIFGWGGVPQDRRLALSAFRRGCLGDAECCVRAVDACRRLDVCTADEVAQLERQAAAQLERRCNESDAASCSVLGHLRLTRGGVPPDVDGAMALLRRGCEGGSCGFLRHLAADGSADTRLRMRAKGALASIGATLETCHARTADLVRRCFTDDRIGFVMPVCDELRAQLSKTNGFCPPAPTSRAIALVNDYAIELHTFRPLFFESASLLVEQGAPREMLYQFGVGRQVLDQLINGELLAQAAEARGLVLSAEELAALGGPDAGTGAMERRRAAQAWKLAEEVRGAVTLTASELELALAEARANGVADPESTLRVAALERKREQALRSYLASLRETATIVVDEVALDKASQY